MEKEDRAEMQEPSEDRAETQEPSETPESLQEKIKELEKELKNSKAQRSAELSALSKKQAELEKKLEEKNLETMSSEEKLKALEEAAEKSRKKRDEFEAETKRLKRQTFIDKLLTSPDIDLPIELFGDSIQGDTEEEMRENALKKKAYIDELVDRRVNDGVNRKLAGKPPRGGETGNAAVIKRAVFDSYSPQQKLAAVKNGAVIED